MARRRADKGPGLLARVRWANLGRSAALLAAGLIVVTRGCGQEAPAVRLPPPGLARPQAPSLVAPARAASSGSQAGTARRRSLVRHPRRKHHRAGRELRKRAIAPVSSRSAREGAPTPPPSSPPAVTPAPPSPSWQPPPLPEFF